MRFLAALLLLPLATAAAAQPAQDTITIGDARISLPPSHPPYPATARGDVVEEQFGQRVADPYRWLENDVRQDQRVRDWVTAQNAASSAFLAQLPGRAAIRARMTELYNYERFGLPERAGNFYFYHTALVINMRY